MSKIFAACGRGAMVLAGLIAAAPGAGVAVAQPVFDEGVPVPRAGTPEERAWEALHPAPPPYTPRGPFAQPQGPLFCPGEYEPCDGLLLAWEGGASLNAIQAQMIRHITTTGAANAYVVVDDTGERTTALASIQSAGANMARVVPYVRTTDSIWIRDYGPRYSYEGNCRVISDHTYNRPTRVNDDTLPVGFASLKRHARYVLPLIHGGGNYHLSSLGDGYATQLIVNENPTRTPTQIIDLWRQHWGPVTTITPAFPTAVDSTQHIDMWVQIIGDRAVVVSDWPASPGSTQDVICDQRAAAFAAAGWAVTRVPAFSIAGVHYTYTNVVMCNNLVLIPLYTNGSVAPSNAVALAAYQSALPARTFIQINCDAIVPLAGVMHCIVMHVPAHRGLEGGLAPTAYVRSPNAGGTLLPGSTLPVRWISDDNVGVVNVDVALSLDDGLTWPVSIASATPDDGVLDWVVPAGVYSTNARVRVLARDADGRTGGDVSDVAFQIGEPPCDPDYNADGNVDQGDVDYLVAVVAGGANPSGRDADFTGDGNVDQGDVDALIGVVAGGACP